MTSAQFLSTINDVASANVAADNKSAAAISRRNDKRKKLVQNDVFKSQMKSLVPFALIKANASRAKIDMQAMM